MDTSELINHPTVQLNFPPYTLDRHNFACYYQKMQRKAETLLSLLEMISHYQQTPWRTLLEEVRES